MPLELLGPPHALKSVTLVRSLALSVCMVAVSTTLRAQARPATGDPVAGFLGHGVSRELAMWRARSVSDVRYDLALDVTAGDSARGYVNVRFRRTGTADVVLDFRGRRVTRMVANNSPLDASAFNGNHVRVPARLLPRFSFAFRATDRDIRWSTAKKPAVRVVWTASD